MGKSQKLSIWTLICTFLMFRVWNYLFFKIIGFEQMLKKYEIKIYQVIMNENIIIEKF